MVAASGGQGSFRGIPADIFANKQASTSLLPVVPYGTSESRFKLLVTRRELHQTASAARPGGWQGRSPSDLVTTRSLRVRIPGPVTRVAAAGRGPVTGRMNINRAQVTVTVFGSCGPGLQPETPASH
jgi:hypothetical protein